MSSLGMLYTAEDAFTRAKEVRARKEEEYYKVIDKDVQVLIEKVNELIDNELPKKNGIYTLIVPDESITYKPRKRILERFDEKMSKNYCVSWGFKPALLKKGRKWVIQFRPKTMEEKQENLAK